MAHREAIQLLRALAQLRNITSLIKIPNMQIQQYCIKMKNSPGFIKWFVSVVQTGIRPEEALDKNDIFLDFCMSNVYGFLSEKSKKVLDVMLVVPGTHSQAELAFLSEMDAFDLQPALQQLLATPMILMSTRPRGSSFTSDYTLADLPRDYLSSRHAPSTEQAKSITKKRRQLVAEEEDEARREQTFRFYSPFRISRRTNSDLIVAKFLKNALSGAYDRDFEYAEKQLTMARSLAPEYFEVHRVEAWIKVKQRNIPAAQLAYEAAIELEPRHAPLLYWYADFLLRYLDDSKRALGYYEKASQIDPNSIDIQIGMARSQIYVMNLDVAQTTLTNLLEKYKLSEMETVKVYDLYIQTFQRQADHSSREGDFSQALKYVDELRSALATFSKRLIDTEMMIKIRKTLPTLQTCRAHAENAEQYEIATKLLEWVNNIEDSLNLSSREGRKDVGHIERIHAGYGIIKAEDGAKYRFNRGDLFDSAEWQSLKVGYTVRFSLFKSGSELQAVGIRIDETE